jgi:ATP-dependent protease La (Lon)-like substrate-binding protein/GIY-YIG catalytic domain-containing protein
MSEGVSKGFVYRHFDAEGRLMYIGSTKSIPNRTGDHQKGAPWWHDVARITVERYPTREEAYAVEKIAIKSEKPKYNKIHKQSIPNYAVLPLRDLVMFPRMIVPLFVGRKKSILALEEAMPSDTFILLATQKNASDDDPATEAIYEVGTLASVLQLLKLPDGARGQHEGERRQRLVRVLRRAATHATGVVGNDAADRASRCACRIGAEAVAVREQREVCARQDRAGARSQAPSPCFDADAGPMPPHVNQNAIILWSNEATRVHHADRGRGRLSARGGRAASFKRIAKQVNTPEKS